MEDGPHLLCTGSLSFTDNKGQNAANYFKEKDVTAQGGKWSNWLHSILGWFSTDFRKLKILNKHLLLSPGWWSFSKNKPHSGLGTMQAWFPMGEPVRGRGSCPLLNLASHWLFWVETGPHFPRVERFPIVMCSLCITCFIIATSLNPSPSPLWKTLWDGYQHYPQISGDDPEAPSDLPRIPRLVRDWDMISITVSLTP